MRNMIIGRLTGVLTGLLLLCARGLCAVSLDVSGTVFLDANNNGIREGDERALTGIVISDGLEVVQTNDEGHYHLSTESSRVLFVSFPAHYRAQGNFYESLRDHHHGDTIDFPLLKNASADDFSFIFFTDCHLTSQKSFNAEAGVKAAIDHMNRQKATLAISGGDLIMDALGACEPEARAQYQLCRELFAALNMPLFNTLGNHDLYGIYLDGVGDDACIVEEDDPLYGVGLYREYLGPDYYSFNWGPYHFIVVNTIGQTKVHNNKGDTVRSYYGTVSREQVDWLKKDLSVIPALSPLILISHIPFLTAVHTFEGYSDYQVINYDLDDPQVKSYTHVVSNTAEVINDILAGHHLILALAGHHHHYEIVQWADNEHDAKFVIGGSISGQWWQGDRLISGSSWPEGYVLVQLKKGHVQELRYVSFDWRGYKE